MIAVDPSIGPAMVQYYKMFLQPMNAFLEENKNLGDAMDFGQRFHNDVGEQVRNTLEVMERAGGPGAFKSIKFAIPVCKYTYHIYAVTRVQLLHINYTA